MRSFEAGPVDVDVGNEELFEDITSELYSAVDSHLGDMELICAPHFTFQETMASFEAGHAVLDLRLSRHKVVQEHEQQFAELEKWSEGDCLSQAQKLAVLKELFYQFANWQAKAAFLQQSVHSCLILSKKRYYQSIPELFHFIEALHYIVITFQHNARGSSTFSEEDFAL